jgi:hypothetical protein
MARNLLIKSLIDWKQTSKFKDIIEELFSAILCHSLGWKTRYFQNLKNRKYIIN